MTLLVWYNLTDLQDYHSQAIGRFTYLPRFFFKVSFAKYVMNILTAVPSLVYIFALADMIFHFYNLVTVLNSKPVFKRHISSLWHRVIRLIVLHCIHTVILHFYCCSMNPTVTRLW